MIVIAQLIMHMAEPFLHRYLIRGKFIQEDSEKWHHSFAVLWATVYFWGLMIYMSSGVELNLFSTFMILLNGATFRWTMQSFVLNRLLMQDTTFRNWYDLRNKGVDGAVVWVFARLISMFRTLDDVKLRVASQKASIVTGVVCSIILLTLNLLWQIK